ncbi:MAG: hypothetical protein A2Y53_08475 [Chloroflexi bacterium RBG_16_47_49]|nr:MAG: hypothetical protein A2Y53_08475 [Chloroflexi bacterium RBG_16_47_49]
MGKADAIGYAVCHRIDTRSLHIGIVQLPLCARCTGQYLGAITGLVGLSLFGRRRSGFPPKHIMGLLLLLILFYVVDGLNSYLSLPPFIKIFPGMLQLYQPSNIMRLFTGTGMGLAIASVLYPAFWGSIITNPDPRPAIQDLKSLFMLLGVGILVDLLVLTGYTFVLFPAAMISALGVVLILTVTYTILWLRITHKENQFILVSQITLQLIGGFLMTIAQIGLFDLIRFIITGTWNGLVFG